MQARFFPNATVIQLQQEGIDTVDDPWILKIQSSRLLTSDVLQDGYLIPTLQRQLVQRSDTRLSGEIPTKTD
jgi:hypothetical protein